MGKRRDFGHSGNTCSPIESDFISFLNVQFLFSFPSSVPRYLNFVLRLNTRTSLAVLMVYYDIVLHWVDTYSTFKIPLKMSIITLQEQLQQLEWGIHISS
jgi:hypothetical protein